MKRLVNKHAETFLRDVNRLEGGNVESVDLRMEADEIIIIAYPERAEIKCTMALKGILGFKLFNPGGAEFFGLSGYPNSLEIIWRESSVLVAIGANEAAQDFESLKNCNFYVHAKELYVDVFRTSNGS